VGTFSLSIASWVEDAVLMDLPHWLARHRGLRVESLEHGHLSRTDGREEEVDAFGVARADEGEVLVVAEAKNRVREREVRAFASKLARLEAPHPILGVLVGHFVDREAEAIGCEQGVVVVSTVGLRR
jgi:hypothetical protein